MKKKMIIVIIGIISCVAIGITAFIINRNMENKKGKDTDYEKINIIEEENEEINNEIQDISQQIKELEQQLESETENKTNNEIQNKIKELKEKEQSLNQKKEENDKNLQEIVQNSQLEEKNTIISNNLENKQEIIEIEESNNNIEKNQNNDENSNTKEENKSYFIKLSKTSITVEEGLRSEKIKIEFSIDDVKDYHLNFKKSDESIANVTWNDIKDGIYIDGYKAGKTTITITDSDEPGASATLNVTVTPKTRVSSITLDKSHIDGYIGKIYEINSTINPSNAQEQYTDWKSSNESVAIVNWYGGNSKTGIVKAVGEGNATITATTLDGGHTAMCTINVKPIAVEGIKITTEPARNYYKGDTLQLKYKIIPDDATNQRVIWKSDNTSIATVDKNGMVTFKEGIFMKNVHITVTSEDGNYSDSISLYCVPSNN